MDPLVRMMCYFVIAALLWAGSVWSLLAVGLLSLVTMLILAEPSLGQLWRMLWRLKWLCLSLLVVYGWLTPGEPLWKGMFSPSRDGMAMGLYRLGYLLVLVLAARIIVLSMRREQLVAALYQLMWPLGWAGRLRERLVVRLLLVFEIVRDLDPAVLSSGEASSGGRMSRLAGTLAVLYRRCLDRADRVRLRPIRFARPSAPPWWQWSWPLGLGLALWWLARLPVPGN